MSGHGGFTLIEVLAAITVFTLLFLGSAGAVGTLAAEQGLTYQRAVAAAGAVLLIDWHATRALRQDPQLGFLDNAAAAAASTSVPLRLLSPTPSLRWVGGEYSPGDAVLVFNGGTITDSSADGAQLDLDAYRGLILTLSAPAPREADSGVVFRQLSCWQGDREAILAGRPGTARFLGRFLIPDRCTP